MAPEHRDTPMTALEDEVFASFETMQRGHVASNGCFPGQNLYHVPHYPSGFSSQTLDLKYAYGDKQANPHFKTDGSVNTEKLALSYECLGRPVNEENIYFWSGFSPNLFEEMHTQSHQFDGCLYPPNHRHYFPTNWFPQVPFRMIPQSYPLEYGLQDFQYFVVIDFEATCDKEKNPHPQEIIEFPSVLVNSRTGLLEDCFQIYVRPTHNQLLTDFCKELTGIQQSQVDKGVLLSEALLMHDKWLEDKGIKHTNFAIVTWSNWDCRVMLESECRFKRIRKPPYFNRWINLKIPFCEAFGGVRCNLKEAVDLAGLTWQGRAHCGLDDAKNTARLLSHLMNLGLKLSITSSIFWQSADCSQIIRHHHPYPHHQQIASPPEYRLPYQPQPQPQPEPHKWKTASVITVIPYPTIQTESPVKELQVYCYCGAMSVKRVVRKPGPQHGSFFFGCGNWTANRGAICSFFKWASESAESAS